MASLIDPKIPAMARKLNGALANMLVVTTGKVETEVSELLVIWGGQWHNPPV